MLKFDLGLVSVLGFARYRLNDEADPAQFVTAAREWQKSFLKEQPGIAVHCLLGNLKGEFADAILATDQASFLAMSQAVFSAPSSKQMMDMLDQKSIRLSQNMLLGTPKPLPDGFSCIEFGTFKPKDTASFSEIKLMADNDKVEQEYLSQFNEVRGHFIGKIGDETYSEISFVEDSGAAREICNGYLKNKECLTLLEQFEPTSMELDFWHLLA